MTRRLLSIFCLGWALISASAASEAETDQQFEERVSKLTEARDVTVIHFWAPWCANCAAEFRSQGWAKFVADNPSVKVVFINIWHKGLNPAPKLKAAGLGGQKNFLALDHPNPSATTGERVERFLDYPLAWTPSTWVYRSGKLRYALNYGEIRFAVLEQLVKDADTDW